jgi:uncharacterized repeat protein (TIGR01451 family)
MKKYPLFNAKLLLLPFLLFTMTLCAQWQQLPGPPAGNVTCWASSPTGVLYVGGTDGIFTSIDVGRTWNKLPSNTLSRQIPLQLEWDNSNLFLSTRDRNTDDRILWKSSNNGTTWVKLWSDLCTDIGFLSLFDARNDTILAGSSPNNHLSIDGGQTWLIDLSVPCWRNVTGTKQGWFQSFYSGASRWIGGQSWNQTYMASDESAFPRRILEAGDFVFIFFGGDTNLFKFTTNGGNTWQDGALPIEYNEDEVSVGERNDTIFVQGASTIAFSTDGLQTWETLPTPGLSGPVNACFFTASGAIVACTGHGIFRADFPGATFLPTKGFSCPNVLSVLHENNGGWWLGLTNGLFYSPDNGASWQEMLTQFTGANREIRKIKKSGNSVVVSGYNSLFYSPDNGVNWTERSVPNTYVGDIALIAQRLFTGNSSSSSFSDDWGATWQLFNPIVNNSSVHTQLYAVADSFLAGSASWSGVYLSRDTGATWQNFSAGLSGGVSEITMAPEHLYVVSSNKLYRSPYDAPAWQQIQAPTYIPLGTTLTPWAFHFSGDQILAGIPKKGIFKLNAGAQFWNTFAVSDLDYRSNAFSFSDSLTIMAVDGGIYYLGSIGAEVIAGHVFVDANQNTVFDSTEIPLSGQLVGQLHQQVYTVTDQQGRYTFDWHGKADSVGLQLYWAGVAVLPAKHIVTGPGTGYDFAISTDDFSTDLSIDLTAAVPPRPGFTFNLYITCRNYGLYSANASVTLFKDLATDWVSFSATPDLLSPDSAQWLVTNIPPGGSAVIQVSLELGATVMLGSLLNFDAKIATVNITDQRSANNDQHYSVGVVGSFDPNDKSVIPSGAITPAMVADSQQLTYTIRFQNTGNYPAEFVRVTDILSPSLDLSSLRLLSSSHPCTWSLNGRMVAFFFPNIQLADSTSNEAGSHGFVKFSIAARKDLMTGDAVKNFADIFFDFNTPVRTNTVETKVAELVIGTATPTPALQCRVSPNPVKDRLSVVWENPGKEPVATLQIFDLRGKLILSTQSTSPANLSVKNLAAGAYQLIIRTDSVSGQSIFVKTE